VKYKILLTEYGTSHGHLDVNWLYPRITEKWFELLTANAKGTPVLASIPATFDRMEFEGWETKQC
jgi:hypothetical protein